MNNQELSLPARWALFEMLESIQRWKQTRRPTQADASQKNTQEKQAHSSSVKAFPQTV